MLSKKNLNQFDIEKINEDLNDEGIIYDLNIQHIDVLSLDQDNEDREDGEKKYSSPV